MISGVSSVGGRLVTVALTGALFVHTILSEEALSLSLLSKLLSDVAISSSISILTVATDGFCRKSSLLEVLTKLPA